MKAVSGIEKVFGAAAHTYEESANVQRHAALLLGRHLGSLVPNLPPGAVLELACGTGLFTRELVELCSGRDLTISDVSAEMLIKCQSRLNGAGKFAVLDGEKLAERNHYALIACAFGAQWFVDLRLAFAGIMQALVPGGCFLFSLPTDSSFPEWKTVCAASGLEYTGNRLPTVGTINNYCLENGYASDLHATQIRAGFASSLDFFQALRSLGAQTRTNASERGSPANLRKLIKYWDSQAGGQVTVTYDVLYGALKKQ